MSSLRHNLYFDNAATSFPKPCEVGQAMSRYLERCGGSYGRGFSARVSEATSMVEECRDMLARAMGVGAGNVFFSSGATASANLILKGLPLSGRRVLVSGMEHNAVMRPLDHLVSSAGTRIEYLPSLPDGTIDVDAMPDLSGVALMAINHQSNVNGVIQPLARIMEAAGGVPVMVDATQSICASGMAGLAECARLPQYIIFTGHKGLYGPTGTGGTYIADPDQITPLLHGGTGSNSDSFRMPEFYPDRLEAGTPNTAGICGLLAAMQNPPRHKHTFADMAALMDRIAAIPGVDVLRAADPRRQGEAFSVTHRSMDSSQLAGELFSQYGCETRPGLHCAPLAHRTLGTIRGGGTVRVSLSAFHTAGDLEYLAGAFEAICGK